MGAVLAEVVVVADAHADQWQGTFTGIVRDAKTGAPLEGAVIVATSKSLQGEETAKTDATGTYRLPNLPPGTYELQVFASDHDPTTRIGLRLSSHATLRVNFSVQATEGAVERRVIDVQAPVIDVKSTSVGQSFDAEFTRRVPIVIPTAKGGAQRSFEAVAEATPGAVGDQYGTSVAGSTSPENAYVVDGLNVGDSGFGLAGIPLSVEFLDHVTVEAGGFMPEYGRATGGVINAQIKSGSNEFHGHVWLGYTPGQLEGQRRVAERAGSTVVTERPLGWIGDAGFDLGGPIVKDRLWFYTGFQVAHTTYNLRRSLYRDAFIGWQGATDPETGEALVGPDGNPLLASDANGNAIAISQRERIPGSESTRRAQSTALQAIAKLTYRASDNHKLSLTGIYAPYLSGGNGAYGIDPEDGALETTNLIGSYRTLGHSYNGNAVDVIAKWNATTDSKKWLFDTTIGYHHQRQTRLPSDGSRLGGGGLAGLSQVIWRRNNPSYHSLSEFEDLAPGVAEACRNVARPILDNPTPPDHVTCPVTEYNTGGPGFLFDRSFDRVVGRHMITFFGRGAGHHEVKLGVDVEYLQFRQQRGYSGGRMLRESTNGNTFSDYRQYGVLTGPDEASVLPKLDWTTRSVVLGAFLQDSWSIMDRVTINAGLRYDAQIVYGGDGEVMMSLPTQVAPRVGVVWDPTQEGRAKLFGNYGRFYQTVPLDIADRAGSGEPNLQGVWAGRGAGGTCDPVMGQESCRGSATQVPLGGSTTPDQSWYAFGGKTPVDPKLKAQSQDELIFGAQYQLFESARVAITYQRRWLSRAIEDMSRDEAYTYFIGNPGEGIARDFPRARRNYDAITLLFHKDFSKNWLLSASYTASWLRGNIAGLFRPETGQLDPFINSDFDLVSLLPNRYGYLPGDHRHVFKVFAAGQVELGKRAILTFGGGITAYSGGPTDYLGSHPLYGPDEAFILPRGSGPRLPWVVRVDPNLGYIYQISKDLAIQADLTVYNAFNFQSVTLVDSSYTNDDVEPIPGGTPADLARGDFASTVTPNPNYGRPIAFQAPRQFRFGLRFFF